MVFSAFKTLALAAALTMMSAASGAFMYYPNSDYFVTGDGVRLRSMPGTQSFSSILRTMGQNEKLRVSKCELWPGQGPWCQVTDRHGNIGYVSGKMVARKQSTAPAIHTALQTTPPKPQTEKPECTSNFSKAATFFKETQGGANLSTLSATAAKIGDYSATIKIFASSGSVYLHMQMEMPSLNLDVPITVCKKGSSLTAVVRTSNAVDHGTNHLNELVQMAVNDQSAPVAKSITVQISRRGNSVRFSGRSGQTQFEATAAVR